MKTTCLFLTASLLFCSSLYSQHVTEIAPLPGEYWWGGMPAHGNRMPFVQPLNEYDMGAQNNNNQPLLLSSRGRYVWSDKPFRFSVSENGITVRSAYESVAVSVAGSTLRDAYLAACQRHFKPRGTLPDSLFFTMPQYNTWIELMYDQNQPAILKYAQGIVGNNFPAGVLMIDDNWQKYYGNFEFKPEKFPNPKEMIEQLHSMGFKVMLWICPFVSAD
ncbi:MAG: glycoside hydrolase, partial [Prevotella sp.]|nr:glycoside hydrolase [Prevotella sp.]